MPEGAELAVLDQRFELLERVGRGAWGDVLRARDRETGAIVAVKRLRAQADDEMAKERFRREARLLARVRHENVVGYVADGLDASGTPCLVVEWLVGEDLAKRHRARPLSGRAILDVAIQIARGLHALHDAGIVHRDVKPSNVFALEREDGTILAKLIDLGVARGNAESTLTTDGMAIGTPYYMSPEQARGEERVSPASDIFSVGVLLFELCAGVRPFRGDDMFAVLAKIVLSEAPSLVAAARDVPPELDAIVAKALAKEPQDRFASARELGAALAAVPVFRLVPAPAVARPSTPAERKSAVTGGLSATLELRVVTAVFARLAPLGDEAAAKAAFAQHAEAAGGVPYALRGYNVVAVFGGRHSRGDEVTRAAHAALAVAADLRGAQIAIATGRAVANAGGLAGEVIERGAVEIERTRLGQVTVDAITARLLGEEFEVDVRDGARVLVGARAAVVAAGAPVQRTLLGKLTPCVGRDRELVTLGALYDECAAESVARVALVTAPAGAGKSRVRRELVALLRARDPEPLVLVGRGDATAGGSFAMVGGAVMSAAGALAGGSLEVQRALVAELARAHVPADAAATITQGLEDIAGLGLAHGPGDALLAGDRVRRAWSGFLEAETSARPVVLLLDDVQSGDLPSVRLIDEALMTLATRPLLVVAFARPEVTQRFPDLWAGRDVQRIALPPLGKRAATRLAEVALGGDADPAVIARVVERADGNAFFLEELIRAVAQQGAEAALPDSVLGVVQARLDALGAEAKRLLRVASVFGDVFWGGGVAAVLGGADAAATRAELDDLARREVLSRRATSRYAGETEYVFRHALVAEASYATLVDGDRALAHRLAGAWLEGAGERDGARLAEHFERGNEGERARRHWLTAAEQALFGNDFDGAIARAERVSRGENGPREDAMAGAALLVEAEAHRWRGELAFAAERAVAATSRLPVASVAWFHAVREAIAANGRLGHLDAVVAWARRGAEAAAVAGAESTQIACLAPAASFLTYAAREEEASGFATRVEALFAAAPSVEPVLAARVHQVRAVRAGYHGDAEGSLESHAAALDAYTRGGDLRNAALSSANVGFVLMQLGALERAEAALRHAHAVAERLRLGTIGPLALHNLGLVLGNLGRYDEALAVELRAVDVFSRQHDPRLEGAARVYLARIHGLMGDQAGAERETRLILEPPDGRQAVLTTQIGARSVLSRALLEGTGSRDEALACARFANEQLETTPIEEWEWESLARMVLVEALFVHGDVREATDRLAYALDRLALRIDRVRDRDLRRTAVARVPEHVRMVAFARRAGVPVPRSLDVRAADDVS